MSIGHFPHESNESMAVVNTIDISISQKITVTLTGYGRNYRAMWKVLTSRPSAGSWQSHKFVSCSDRRRVRSRARRKSPLSIECSARRPSRRPVPWERRALPAARPCWRRAQWAEHCLTINTDYTSTQNRRATIDAEQFRANARRMRVPRRASMAECRTRAPLAPAAHARPTADTIRWKHRHSTHVM